MKQHKRTIRLSWRMTNDTNTSFVVAVLHHVVIVACPPLFQSTNLIVAVACCLLLVACCLLLVACCLLLVACCLLLVACCSPSLSLSLFFSFFLSFFFFFPFICWFYADRGVSFVFEVLLLWIWQQKVRTMNSQQAKWQPQSLAR